jgi:glutamate-ammonia-ligase adenylyltransferase
MMPTAAILAASRYLQHWITRNPQWQPMCETNQPYRDGELVQKIAAEIQAITDATALLSTVRQIRHRESVRIAWRDLSGLAQLDETLRATSDLADGLVDAALNWCYAELTAKHGIPRSRSGTPQHMVIIGMGKLGGGLELGYGSDLDIIFLHDSQGTAQQTNGKKTLENAVFYARFAQKVIHTLTTFTPAGRLYETDTRLRPT